MSTTEPKVRRQNRKAAEAKRGMRLGGYVRVSMVGERDVDSDSYITEDLQREKIEEWAQSKGVEIVGPVDGFYLDRDVSGKTMAALRGWTGCSRTFAPAGSRRDRRPVSRPAQSREARGCDEGGRGDGRAPEASRDPGHGGRRSDDINRELVLNVMLAIARLYGRPARREVQRVARQGDHGRPPALS